MRHRQFWSVALVITALLAGCQSIPEQTDKKTPDQSGAQAQLPVEQTPEESVRPAPPNTVTVKPLPVIKPKPEKLTIERQIKQTPAHISDKLVLGIAEKGHLLDANLTLKAKIDTGADASSVDARNIQPFERDGKRWVRFDITRAEQGLKTLELPVERTIRIKRPGLESVERPVVLLTVRVGDITQKLEFNLTNREDFTHPLLVGRTFLKDLAVVDVSQEYIAEPKLLRKQKVAVEVMPGQARPKNPEIVSQPISTRHRPVLGSIEQAFLPEQNIRLDARIDTGAHTSSLDARNIEKFQRAGKPWVRFEIHIQMADKPVVKMELPVKRDVKIRRHGAEADERLVVEMNTRIGSITQMTEFTLRDRSEYDYPILIGYRFLKDKALVDVSQPYLTDIFKQRALAYPSQRTDAI